MKTFRYGISALFISLTLPAFAQVISDDVIVQGNLCVGADCVNGEDFSEGSLKLKENNLRIRWFDSSASGSNVRQTTSTTYMEGTIGESWRMDANQSMNGGINAFYINQQSLDTYPVLSNGAAPDYDCSGSQPFPVVGTIPAGSNAEDAACQPLRQTLQVDGLVLGGASGDGVALGSDAELNAGQVSLGKADIRRRLAHVASALTDSDVLIKSQLDMGLFEQQSQRMDGIEALLDSAEQEITFLEAATLPKRSESGGTGSLGDFVVLLALVAFGRATIGARRRFRR